MQQAFHMTHTGRLQAPGSSWGCSLLHLTEKGCVEKHMKTMVLKAEIDRVDDVISFINAELAQYEVPVKTLMQLDIAAEEIFVNIARYAYAPEEGEAAIGVSVEEDPPCAVIRFADRGRPYDPLSREDPDITLGIEDRKIGGLGVYMVRKSMDEVTYTWEDGQNILTIRKLL